MFFEYLLNSQNDEILNEVFIDIGEGRDKETYKFVPPGHASADSTESHVDRRIKFGKGSDRSMMSLAIDPNARTVDLKHSKMGKEKCTTDDFKTVVSYANAIMAYDYERFSRIATSKNSNEAAKELMEDFNALPKSERDKYYKQGKENFNKYNKNIKWPR